MATSLSYAPLCHERSVTMRRSQLNCKRRQFLRNRFQHMRTFADANSSAAPGASARPPERVVSSDFCFADQSLNHQRSTLNQPWLGLSSGSLVRTHTLCESKLYKKTRTVFSVHLLLRQGQRSCTSRGGYSAALPGFAALSPSDDCDAGAGGIHFPSARSGPLHHTAVDERAVTRFRLSR